MTTPANDTALLAVHGAVYARLSADPALAVDAGVHDQVPEGAPFPYVVVGEAVETPDNDLATFGSRVAATLHVFSTYRGWAETARIVGHLMRLLDHQDLTVPGRALIVCRHEQTVTMRDPDPDVRHAAVRFTFDTFPTD